MNDVYVIGVGMTPFRRAAREDLAGLGRIAALEALRDAGLTPAAIGGGYFANVLGPQLTGEVTAGQFVLASIGVRRVPIVNVENACSSGSTALWLAVNGIRAGEFDVALVLGAEKMSVPGLGLLRGGSEELETQLGMVMPASFALRAARYLHEFEVTPAALAQVAVKNRRHAALNPLAQFREPVTLAQVLDSPLIADPITRLQCCPTADGAAAAVLASGRVARADRRAVRVDAAVLCTGSYQNPTDLVRWETDRRGSRMAYERAGIGPEDLDVVECHDAFTIAEVLHTEALGLCGPGEGARLAVEGATALGGRIPVNVSGGLLSRGHPLGATGCAQLIEIVQQLRGAGGARQVEGARVGLAQCMGGDQSGDAKSCTVFVASR
ncbi:MAG: thiolase family protein [Gammaproteobacteria bacterium]|nr:thiolase family protein [Gammaproteobacteria bacterium]